MHTTRVLDLPGSCNLRDFGGYATRDARCVRLGRLFRSGTMTRLAPSSVAALRGYGLRAICDLRRTDERQRQPNPDFGADVRALFIAVEAKHGTVECYLHEELGLSQETRAGLRRRLVE